jgi:hypothetical protein
LTTEELEAAQAAGKRLPEIAEEQGVTVAEIEAALQSAFADALAQAVADGTLTQAQADQLLERGLNGGFCGRHGKGHGPRGDFGEQGFGSGNFQNAPADDLQG